MACVCIHPGGGLTVTTVSSYLGLSIHSSKLLCHRLSLVADNVSTGCSFFVCLLTHVLAVYLRFIVSYLIFPYILTNEKSLV